MVFRPLAGCGLFPSGRCLRHGLSGVSVPLRGVGCFKELVNRKTYTIRFPSPCGVWVVSLERAGYHVVVLVSVPLRGVGCFQGSGRSCTEWKDFRPLAGCGLFLYGEALHDAIEVSVPLRGVGCFPTSGRSITPRGVSVPLRGVGCFSTWIDKGVRYAFPSPCGVWVVSIITEQPTHKTQFPSPCGVWVVSRWFVSALSKASFRPLAGCGLFRQSCTFFLVQQEKELSTLLFYCIILADVYQ